MGKKKDSFIDRSKAITFKLSYRDGEDPLLQKENATQRVFEIKSMPLDSRLTEEERKRRDKLLAMFTDEDQGKFDREQKEPEPEGYHNKFWVPPEIRKKLAGKDLWIDQLAAKSQIDENDVEDYEIEELEDVEEEGDYTDEEDIEDENEIPATNKNKATKKAPKQEDDDDIDIDTDSEDYSEGGDYADDDEETEQNEKAQPVANIENLTSSDFPDFKFENQAVKKIVEENMAPMYDKIVLSKDVKLRKFNEYGLPIGNKNFDYTKYFVQPHQQNEGVVEAVLWADVKKRPHVTEDIDYEWNEMTEEQREVFEALNYEMEDGAYEELEEDFLNTLTEGQKAIIHDGVEEEIKTELEGGKKKRNATKKNGKKIDFTFDEEGKLTMVEGAKKKKTVEKGVKKVMIKEYSQPDSRPEEDKTKVEAFDRVMKEFDESDDENYQGSGDEDYDVPELAGGVLTGEGFNKILDEHISEMSTRKQELYAKEQEKQAKAQGWGVKGKVNPELEEMQQKRYQEYSEFAAFDDIVRRKIYEQLPVAKDNALQSYLALEQRREDEPHLFFENYDRPVGENKLDETIATKNFSFSKVHESLTIIGDDINLSRSKKYNRLRQAEDDDEAAESKKQQKNVEKIQESDNEKGSEDEDDEEEEEEEKDPLKIRSYELSKKIGRDETKEEKAARKKALKEFKDARKSKKKMFKDGFEQLTKEHQNKFVNRTNHHNMQNVKGISIKPMH